MNGNALTQTEQYQVSALAQRMENLSAEELETAHRAWQQAARNITDYATARRLYLEHMALEQAVQSKLDFASAWRSFAFQQAFGGSR